MKKPIWIIGASKISEDYSKVLDALNISYDVIGRGIRSASSFKKATGHEVKTGGLTKYLKKSFPDVAIVAVGVEELFQATKELIESGTKRILLEKPGSVTTDEIIQLNNLANKKKIEVLIAYNRRFYQSVYKMKKLIVADGGVSSINFEFTEWIHKLNVSKRNPKILERWLVANSHVIDLAFHLCGKPKDWNCWQSDSFDWHPASARFCGSGITDKKILFSYLSDWKSPGSWGLELLTGKNRYILKPLEDLKVVRLGSVKIEKINIEEQIDKKFKPGLFIQTKKFIEKNDDIFCTLNEQVENMKIFYKIAGY
jgi:hypothetical protein